MAQQDKKVSAKGFTVKDNRWWLRDDVDLDKIESGEPNAKPPTYVEKMESRLTKNDRILREYIAAHKASNAEMDAVRNRLERDLDRRVDVERARLAEPFLDVLDNFERLLEACKKSRNLDQLLEGANLVFKQIREKLKDLGMELIDAQGHAFDPKIMEAMATINVPKKQDGKVLEVIQPGYTLHDRVLRPARVKVGITK
jgi:molecular chaperone GrpE